MNRLELIRRIRELSRPLEPEPSGLPIRLNVLDGIETVLFDVYGTLLISASGEIGTADQADHAEALVQALAVSGFEGDIERAGAIGPALLRQEIERAHELARKNGIAHPEVDISGVWLKIIQEFQRLGLLGPEHPAGGIARLAVEYECRINPAWPMPGAAETLAFCRARGLKTGLVSNAQFYTPLALEALFGCTTDELGFDPALCVWSFKELRAKPSVELFERLPADLSKAVYVGNDMLNDIRTASRAGCRTILFAGDRRSLRLREGDPRCDGVRPDAIADDLRQVTELL